MDVLIISYNGIMGTPILVKNPNLFDEDILKSEIDYGYMLDKIKSQIQPYGYEIEWFTEVEINNYS